MASGSYPSEAAHVDLYVTHEQSHVPFRAVSSTATGIQDRDGCSRTRHGHASACRSRLGRRPWTLPSPPIWASSASARPSWPAPSRVRRLHVPGQRGVERQHRRAGRSAVYEDDPSMPGLAEAGYARYLNTVVDWSQLDVIPGLGRHNHENTVVVPGGWDELADLSGDDTFTAPSSQLYLYTAADPEHFFGQGQPVGLPGHGYRRIGAGRALSTQPTQNDANDYLDISAGETWWAVHSGPPDVARGDLQPSTPRQGSRIGPTRTTSSSSSGSKTSPMTRTSPRVGVLHRYRHDPVGGERHHRPPGPRWYRRPAVRRLQRTRLQDGPQR